MAAENDCKAATLGIYSREYQSEPANFAGVFIGTGIGGGLILNHQLFTGPTFTAFEIGHMIIDFHGPQCTSGIHGSLEAFASKTAIANRIAAAVKSGKKTVLTSIVDGDLSKLGSRDLKKALKKGDELVTKTLEDTARMTGIGLANLITILNLQTIVLGGGIIEAVGEMMLPTIIKSAATNSFPGAFEGVRIATSKLGDHAGILGAAFLAKSKFGT